MEGRIGVQACLFELLIRAPILENDALERCLRLKGLFYLQGIWQGVLLKIIQSVFFSDFSFGLKLSKSNIIFIFYF